MDHHTWEKWLLLVVTGLFTVLLMGESFLSTGRWINQPFPGFFVHENLTVAPTLFRPGPDHEADYSLWTGCLRSKTARLRIAPSFTKSRAARPLAPLYATGSPAAQARSLIPFRQ